MIVSAQPIIDGSNSGKRQRYQLVGGRLACRRAARSISSSLAWISARFASMCAATSPNGRPCPGRQSRASSAVDRVEAVEELRHRVRRPAVVEVERHAAEQVVAAQQQPLLAPGTAPRARAHAPACRARSRRHGRSRPRRRAPAPGAARSRAAMPGFESRRSSAQRRSGSTGTPLWRATSTRRSSERSGSVDPARHVLVARVHPQLAAGALDDRRREPVVVGVGVRADHQTHVLEPAVDQRQRALQLRAATPPRG